ncbi:hypothetical protein [Streptomyces sp. NPDC099088]|uniref:hypothetical protein n=1 Tax=Streptomyces sp. NPDC099088 TaxID=3366101 RepID=UPI003802B3D4
MTRFVIRSVEGKYLWLLLSHEDTLLATAPVPSADVGFIRFTIDKLQRVGDDAAISVASAGPDRFRWYIRYAGYLLARSPSIGPDQETALMHAGVVSLLLGDLPVREEPGPMKIYLPN